MQYNLMWKLGFQKKHMTYMWRQMVVKRAQLTNQGLLRAIISILAFQERHKCWEYFGSPDIDNKLL